MAGGTVFTVATAKRRQPVVADVYVILAVPADTPHRLPVDAPMVATATLSLSQVPPEGVLPSVLHTPWHRLSVPVMADGNALTVTVAVTVQPEPSEYTIVLLPGATP